MAHVAGLLVQLDAPDLLRGVGRVEEAQLDGLRVPRVDREVRPLAVEGRTERVRAPGPDQLAVHESPASHRAP